MVRFEEEKEWRGCLWRHPFTDSLWRVERLVLRFIVNFDIEAPSTTTTTSSTTTTTSTSTTKERSSTVVADVPNADLKVSASFSSEETNQKLKTSTHVVVDEEPDEDDGKTEGCVLVLR